MGADESLPLPTPELPPATQQRTLGGGFHRGNIHRRLDVLLDALEQHGATVAVGEEGKKHRRQLSDLARMEWAQIDAAVLEHIARVTGTPVANPEPRGLSPPLQYPHNSQATHRRRRRKRSKHHRSPSPVSVTSSTTSSTATASSNRSQSPYTTSPSPSPPPGPSMQPLKQWSRPSVSPPPSSDAKSSAAVWPTHTSPTVSPSRTSSTSPEPRWVDVDKTQR